MASVVEESNHFEFQSRLAGSFTKNALIAVVYSPQKTDGGPRLREDDDSP